MRAWLADSIDDAASFLKGPRGTRAARRHAQGPLAAAILAALCAAVYLPGLFSIPAVDRDESRFAQASRQMFEAVALPKADQSEALHGGGLIEPRVGEKSRLNKPPLIYWLQSASAALFTAGDPSRDAIWMYRIPSVLAATLAVLFTWRAGLILFDPRVAVLGAALLAICPIVVWDAHQARADQLLLACTTAAFWILAKLYTTKNLSPLAARLLPPAFATAIALGILAKGPITPMIAALTVAALILTTREWRWTKRLRPLALLIVLALTLPWLIALANRVGFAEYLAIIKDETLGRSASAKEGHWGPPGYHLVFLVVMFWPGVILTAISITRAIQKAWGTQPTTITNIPADPSPITAPDAHPLTPDEPEAQARDLPQSEAPLLSPPSPSTTDPTNLPIPLEPEAPTPPPPAAPTPSPLAANEPETQPTVTLTKPPLTVRLRAAVNTLTRPPTGRPAELFCLAWIIPAWIVFELVSTKLPHYTMPLYPAIALLSARGLLAAVAGSLPAVDTKGTQLGLQLWLLVGAVITVAAPITIALLGGAGLWIILAVALATASAALLWLARDAISRSLLARATTLAVIAGVLGTTNLVAVALPKSTSPWLTTALMRTATDAGWDLSVPIAAAGYHEDSLVFATRARLQKTDDPAAWARTNRGLLIAPAGTHTAFQADTRITADLVDTISGYNYSTGKILQLELIDTRP